MINLLKNWTAASNRTSPFKPAAMPASMQPMIHSPMRASCTQEKRRHGPRSVIGMYHRFHLRETGFGNLDAQQTDGLNIAALCAAAASQLFESLKGHCPVGRDTLL